MGMFPYIDKGESPRKDMSGQIPDITSEITTYHCGECGNENKKNAYGYYYWKCHDCQLKNLEA